MGVFGIAKAGFGRAVKAYKQSKIKSGKATREERIKYGGRSPDICLLYTSPSPRDRTRSRMPSSA